MGYFLYKIGAMSYASWYVYIQTLGFFANQNTDMLISYLGGNNHET